MKPIGLPSHSKSEQFEMMLVIHLRLILALRDKIGTMKVLIKKSYNHITIAKVICLALLFSPLWGLWWFKIDVDAHWFSRSR